MYTIKLQTLILFFQYVWWLKICSLWKPWTPCTKVSVTPHSYYYYKQDYLLTPVWKDTPLSILPTKLSQVSNNNSSFLFLLFIQSLGDGMLLIYCKPFQVLYTNFRCYISNHPLDYMMSQLWRLQQQITLTWHFHTYDHTIYVTMVMTPRFVLLIKSLLNDHFFNLL